MQKNYVPPSFSRVCPVQESGRRQNKVFRNLHISISVPTAQRDEVEMGGFNACERNTGTGILPLYCMRYHSCWQEWPVTVLELNSVFILNYTYISRQLGVLWRLYKIWGKICLIKHYYWSIHELSDTVLVWKAKEIRRFFYLIFYPFNLSGMCFSSTGLYCKVSIFLTPCVVCGKLCFFSSLIESLCCWLGMHLGATGVYGMHKMLVSWLSAQECWEPSLLMCAICGEEAVLWIRLSAFSVVLGASSQLCVAVMERRKCCILPSHYGNAWKNVHQYRLRFSNYAYMKLSLWWVLEAVAERGGSKKIA